ncbi:nucleotidyltransferase domain-containing protein [Candidatus Pacearchaeota archaeon]|nr:nucleotidyltransferase domain-containing protein [Candidatus Pacearchaeota archaeon]
MVIKLSNVGQLCPDILMPYLKDYSLKLSASEISREVKIERRTISRILNKLVSLNLMDFVIQGKNKLFYFDLKKFNSFSLFNLIEINNSMNFNFKNKNISLMVSKLLNCADGVIVFGSYATSKNKKDSDLDVVLLGKVNEKEVSRVKLISPIEINEHLSSYSEFKKILKSKNALAIEISRSHILFGNFSSIIKIFLEDKING